MREHQKISPSRPETEIVRRVYDEILNEGKLELVEQLVAPGAIDHAREDISSLPISDPDRLKEFVETFCLAFPDAYWTVTEMNVRDDLIAVRTITRGAHHNEFLGLQARGHVLELAGRDLVRVQRGKIVEHWGELDVDGIRAQLDPMFGTHQSLT